MDNSKAGGARRVPCVEPEVLAAYVDRGLSLAERAHVETHLASCPSCAALLAGVVKTVAALAEHRPSADRAATNPSRLDWRSLVGRLAAAAAVIAAVAVPVIWQARSGRNAELVDLAGRIGGERAVLGRLTGGFPHAPLGEPSAGGQDGRVAETADIALIAGKIRESFGERGTPDRLHALGIAQLLAGRYNDAAQSLTAASREQPGNARYLNDVATVQLERARRGLRPDDLPRALASADRALRLNPSLHEARFNRALALSSLSLRDQARQAWTDYLSREAGSPWASEARGYLAQLEPSTAASAWPVLERRLRQGVDAGLAEEAVRTQATESRRFFEATMLPAWVAAVERGDGEGPECESLRHMAGALAGVTGDALYLDAVAAIDRAEAEGHAAVRRLADAHRQYAAGAAHFDANRIADATPVMRNALAALRAERSAFALRAEVDLGALHYVAGQMPDADRHLSAALAAADAAGYGYVAARAHRFLGMLAFGQGRLGDAQASYEAMLAGAERMADAEQAGMAHALLAGLFIYTGDLPNVWRHMPTAGPLAVAVSPSARYLQSTVAAAAIGTENPEAALVLREEVLAAARQWGQPAAITEALTQLAAIRLRLADREGAAQAADAAQGYLEQMEPAVQRRLEVPLLTVLSDINRAGDPARAASLATRAIGLLEARSERLRLAQLNWRLANANIALGRLDEANAALRAGIQAFDEERASLKDEGRISARDELWQLFGTATLLALKEGDLSKAFALAERARARTLAEYRQLSSGRALADLESGLAPGEAVLALNQFDDELAVWVITPAGSWVTMRPLSRADAERLAGRQRDEIRLAAATPAAGAALFNELVRPVMTRLHGVTRLAVVADAPFQDVAFAALWDASRRRFLVEDIATRIVQSASSAIDDHSRAAPSGPRPGPLVLGGPGFEAGARAVATIYASADLVTGSDATASRLLGGAPGRPVVHVSSAIASSDTHPLLSRLVVADEPGRRHSGAIFGRDIADRSFADTEVVVLGGPGPNHREGTAGAPGIARAFLSAGVPAVVGLLPGVDEADGRDALVGFHRQLAASGSAEDALTTYQRSVLKSNGRRLGVWCALVLYGSDR